MIQWSLLPVHAGPSRCWFLEQDQDQWRTEVIIFHSGIIRQPDKGPPTHPSIHPLSPPPAPSTTISSHPEAGGSCVEVRQDRGQAICLWHQFPEHIEGLEWGHPLLCRYSAQLHMLPTLAGCNTPAGRKHHKCQNLFCKRSWRRLVLELMPGMFMLWILFLWGRRNAQCCLLLMFSCWRFSLEVLVNE